MATKRSDITITGTGEPDLSPRRPSQREAFSPLRRPRTAAEIRRAIAAGTRFTVGTYSGRGVSGGQVDTTSEAYQKDLIEKTELAEKLQNVVINLPETPTGMTTLREELTKSGWSELEMKQFASEHGQRLDDPFYGGGSVAGAKTSFEQSSLIKARKAVKLSEQYEEKATAFDHRMSNYNQRVDEFNQRFGNISTQDLNKKYNAKTGMNEYYYGGVPVSDIQAQAKSLEKEGASIQSDAVKLESERGKVVSEYEKASKAVQRTESMYKTGKPVFDLSGLPSLQPLQQFGQAAFEYAPRQQPQKTLTEKDIVDYAHLPGYGEVASYGVSTLTQKRAVASSDFYKATKGLAERGEELEAKSAFRKSLVDAGFYEVDEGVVQYDKDYEQYLADAKKAEAAANEITGINLLLQKYSPEAGGIESYKYRAEQMVVPGIAAATITALTGGTALPVIGTFVSTVEAGLVGKGVHTLSYRWLKEHPDFDYRLPLYVTKEREMGVHLSKQNIPQLADTAAFFGTLAAITAAGAWSSKRLAGSPKDIKSLMDYEIKLKDIDKASEFVTQKGTGAVKISTKTKLFGKPLMERVYGLKLKATGKSQPYGVAKDQMFDVNLRDLDAAVRGFATEQQIAQGKLVLLGGKLDVYLPGKAAGVEKYIYQQTGGIIPTKMLWGKTIDVSPGVSSTMFLQRWRFVSYSDLFKNLEQSMQSSFLKETPFVRGSGLAAGKQTAYTLGEQTLYSTRGLASTTGTIDVTSMYQTPSTMTGISMFDITKIVGEKTGMGGTVSQVIGTGGISTSQVTGTVSTSQLTGVFSKSMVENVVSGLAKTPISTTPSLVSMAAAAGVSLASRKQKTTTGTVSYTTPKVEARAKTQTLTSGLVISKTRERELEKAISLTTTKDLVKKEQKTFGVGLTAPLTITTQKQRQGVLSLMGQSLSDVLIEEQREQNIFKQAQLNLQSLRTLQKTKTRSALLTRGLTSVPTAEIPAITPPTPTTGLSLLDEKKHYKRLFARTQKVFWVFGKRRGRFFKLSYKPLPKKQALSLGGKWAAETAGATFKLKPSKQFVKRRKKMSNEWDKIKKQFYRKGKRTYVEKTRFRIDAPGELEEITYKGLLTKKQKKKLLGGIGLVPQRTRKRKKRKGLLLF